MDYKNFLISCRKVDGEIGPVWLRSLEFARRIRPFSIFFVAAVAWTVRRLDMGSCWIKGNRIGIVWSDTGGLLFRTPAMSCDSAIISLESVASSSSVLLSWQCSAMVTFT